MPVVPSGFEEIELDSGEFLFREGDKNNGRMYVVRKGKLAVLKEMKGLERLINTAESGDVIGEISFFSGEPRTASVKAVDSSSLFVLSNTTFEKMVLRNPEVGLKVIRGLVATLREFEKRSGWR